MSHPQKNIMDYPEILLDANNIEQYLTKRYEEQILNTKYFSDIEIQLILAKNCNLNCTNCQAGCSINDVNEFMTLEEIKYAIPKLKTAFENNITRIVLFGGEPLLNPQYKEICYYIRQEFPNIIITIYSNGLIIQDWQEQDYKFAQDLNVDFILTLYPLKDYIPKIEKQTKLMKQLGINCQINGSRPYFVKGGYNLTGASSPSRFFTCCHSSFPPHFYLYKKKLYRCAVSIKWQDFGGPYIEQDFLDIDCLDKNKILKYCSRPLELCKFCSSTDDLPFGSDEIMIWHSQIKLPSNYQSNLFDLYINDYKTYHNYVHDCKDILPCFQNEYFINNLIEDELPSFPAQMFQIRFTSGLGDICIPFSKEINKNIDLLFELKNLILNQKDYLKMNFYFISLDKDKEAKKNIYYTFPPTSCDLKGNFFLLEAENSNSFYKDFIKNSYLKNKFLLIDYRVLKDVNYLINYFKKENDK